MRSGWCLEAFELGGDPMSGIVSDVWPRMLHVPSDDTILVENGMSSNIHSVTVAHRQTTPEHRNRRS